MIESDYVVLYETATVSRKFKNILNIKYIDM